MSDEDGPLLECPDHAYLLSQKLDHFFGEWIKGDGLKFNVMLGNLAEYQQRMAAGESEPGDFVDAVRILSELVKRNEKDLVWALFQLGRSDEDAQFPFQLVVRERPTTIAMRKKESAFNAHTKKIKIQKRDYALFLRVIDVRKKSKATLDEAFKIVARGDDGPLGFLEIQPRAVSPATVKRAYMANIKTARRNGFVLRSKGMFANHSQRQFLPKLPGKGRPKK